MDAHEERANTSENVIEFQIYPAETTNSIHELKDDIMGILTKEVSGYIWQTEPFSLDVKEGINQQLNKHETTFNFNQFFFYKWLNYKIIQSLWLTLNEWVVSGNDMDDGWNKWIDFHFQFEVSTPRLLVELLLLVNLVSDYDSH